MGSVVLARVVAVVAVLADGGFQVGTGYLITGRRVLTAEHCTRDKRTGQPAVGLEVWRASDGQPASGVTIGATSPEVDGLDLAVLDLAGAPWDPDLPAPVYGRVDRSRSGMLRDCEAVGYPLYQYQAKQPRSTGELHGIIYQTDLAGSGRLLMREPRLTTVSLPVGLTRNTNDDGDGDGGDGHAPATAAAAESPWGGLSGALVFHHHLAIGVIVEHHLQQGASSVQIVSFDQLVEHAAEPHAGGVAGSLRLSTRTVLPVAAGDPVTPLIEVVGELIDGDLPRVDALDPYRLGTSKSDYGNQASYGERDPYVPRTHHQVDDRLVASMSRPGSFTLLVGPSKAGKSRTAFEIVRLCWPHARLVVPSLGGWDRLVGHPRLATTTDPVVVWLDDLNRYLAGSSPLTRDALHRLLARPGPTTVVATLRTDQLLLLRSSEGELIRDTRMLLDAATTVELASTAEDAGEQAHAQRAYPDRPLGALGLAEMLSRSPELLAKYRELAVGDPLTYFALRAAIDWARVGISRAIPEPDLAALAKDVAWSERPDVDTDDDQLIAALKEARKALPGSGQAALLLTSPLPDKVRGYRPFDYLVAADDGQDNHPRPIPADFWEQALRLATTDDATEIGTAAYYRDNPTAAIAALTIPARAGDTVAMCNLGVVLSDRLDPPDLDAARHWYQQAADAGDTGGMYNLGYLLADRLDPPDLDAARHWYQQAADAGRQWYQQAADAGHSGAMFNLGVLLADRLDPPDLDAARQWCQQAADTGDPGAMFLLGVVCLRQLNVVEAEASWQPLWDLGASENATIAAVSLSPILAISGQVAGAVSLLGIAKQNGLTEATAYAAVLNDNPLEREKAVAHLTGADDTDALNFLGVAAMADGHRDKARQFWTDSSNQGDIAAPALLNLTAN